LSLSGRAPLRRNFRQQARHPLLLTPCQDNGARQCPTGRKSGFERNPLPAADGQQERQPMQAIHVSGLLSPWRPAVFSLMLYALVVIVSIAAVLALTRWLGQKEPGPEKLRAYESGIIPTGVARLRYPVAFFMVAIFFLIFDVEGAYIFSWAVGGRSLGWAGWLEISFFILMLLAGLIYIWAKGGLEWGPSRDRNRTIY
jgi:NADH-quinone oxidoreductase subunit A